MSSKRERLTDLFIPIGRPQSSTSSIKTGSSLNTATVSTNVKSDNSPPTTISSSKSAHHESPRISEARSSPSARYTISARSSDTDPVSNSPVVRSSSQNGRPSSVHIRRHSRKLSVPISPVKELSMRLSEVTNRDPQKSDFTRLLTANNPASQVERDVFDSKSTMGITIPSAVTPLVQAPASIGILNTIDPHERSPPKTPPSTTDVIASTMTEEKYPMTPSHHPRLTSHSRSSSQSSKDRSFPPPSFPTAFYEKATPKRPVYKIISRENSTRAASASPRSSSPLKYVIGNSDAEGVKATSSQDVPNQPQVPQTSRSGTQRSRSISSVSISSSKKERDPVHDTIHYYTSCPHSSPPSTRPLNIQPTLDEEYNPPVSKLSGLCFECDTAERRDHESAILFSFNPRIEAHTLDLTIILNRLEQKSQDLSQSSNSLTERFQNLSMNSTPGAADLNITNSNAQDQLRRDDESDDLESDTVKYRIEALQERIAELIQSRDKEVRDIWQGYSQRWGPGTSIGAKALESIQAIPGTPRSGLSRMSSVSGRSQGGTAEGRMKVDWIRGSDE